MDPMSSAEDQFKSSIGIRDRSIRGVIFFLNGGTDKRYFILVSDPACQGPLAKNICTKHANKKEESWSH